MRNQKRRYVVEQVASGNSGEYSCPGEKLNHAIEDDGERPIYVGVRVRRVTQINIWIRLDGERNPKWIKRHHISHLDSLLSNLPEEEKLKSALLYARTYVETHYGRSAAFQTAGERVPPKDMEPRLYELLEEFFDYTMSEDRNNGENKSKSTLYDYRRAAYDFLHPFYKSRGIFWIDGWSDIASVVYEPFIAMIFAKERGHDHTTEEGLSAIEGKTTQRMLANSRAFISAFWKWIERDVGLGRDEEQLNKIRVDRGLPPRPVSTPGKRPRLKKVPPKPGLTIKRVKPSQFRPSAKGHSHIETREGVWREIMALPSDSLKFRAILGYYAGLRPQEIYALTANDFIRRFEIEEKDAFGGLYGIFESKIQASEGGKIGVFLGVQVHRQLVRFDYKYTGKIPDALDSIHHYDDLYPKGQYPRGFRPPKSDRVRTVVLWDERAADWVIEFILSCLRENGKQTNVRLLGDENCQQLYRQWREFGIRKDDGKKPIELKDMRRVSCWWLGHDTNAKVEHLMGQYGHSKEETTRLYMRDNARLDVRERNKETSWEREARLMIEEEKLAKTGTDGSVPLPNQLKSTSTSKPEGLAAGKRRRTLVRGGR